MKSESRNNKTAYSSRLNMERSIISRDHRAMAVGQCQKQSCRTRIKLLNRVQDRLLKVKEQAYRLSSINTNTSLPVHFGEQKGFAPHENQSASFSFLSPQEFQPFPSEFITPPLDPARRASALFRPPCFGPRRNRPRESMLKRDLNSRVGDERVGDDTDVDMLLAKWTTLPVTFMK
jgi:hypothetical protein